MGFARLQCCWFLQSPIPKVPVALRLQLGPVQAEPCVFCSTKGWGKELSCAEPREEQQRWVT